MVFRVARGAAAYRLLRTHWRGGAAGGLITVLGFGSALIALRFAPAGIVSALRETSVAFAMIIAIRVLREPVDRRQLAGAGLIAVGAIAIVISGM